MLYGPWPRKRPVAAAFVFFFLLPAPLQSWWIRPCQGCACAPSAARPALDVAPPGLKQRRKEEEKHKCRSNRPLSRPGAVPHVLLPAATARSGGQGGAQVPAGAPLQHTALRKKPQEEVFSFFTPKTQPRRRASRAGKAHPCRSILKPERCSKTAVRRSLQSGCSSTGRHGSVRRRMNPRTRPAPSRGRCRQAALR